METNSEGVRSVGEIRNEPPHTHRVLIETIVGEQRIRKKTKERKRKWRNRGEGVNKIRKKTMNRRKG